jgi:hypothetical protein
MWNGTLRYSTCLFQASHLFVCHICLFVACEHNRRFVLLSFSSFLCNVGGVASNHGLWSDTNLSDFFVAKILWQIRHFVKEKVLSNNMVKGTFFFWEFLQNSPHFPPRKINFANFWAEEYMISSTYTKDFSWKNWPTFSRCWEMLFPYFISPDFYEKFQ